MIRGLNGDCLQSTPVVLTVTSDLCVKMLFISSILDRATDKLKI